MGTDRSRVYNGPCPCGSGKIEIDFCEPDHPWPTNSTWYEGRLDCRECDKKYRFFDQDHKFGLIKKQDFIEREKLCKNYRDAKDSFLASSQVREVIRKFINQLDSQPSKAAAHRFLGSHNLESESYSTFIKRWIGADKWIEQHLYGSVEIVETFCEIVEIQDEYIKKTVTELKKMWRECQQSLPFYKEPVFDARRY